MALSKAQAGEAVQCGVPVESHVSSKDFVYCNIHDRRIGYKENDDIYRQELAERQADYQEPHARAVADYKARLEEIHADMDRKAAAGNE